MNLFSQRELMSAGFLCNHIYEFFEIIYISKIDPVVLR